MRQIFKIEFGTPEFDEAVQLRFKVLREPLGMEYTVEQLAAEFDQHHLGIYHESGKLLGYLNLTPLDEGVVKMRQVAVHPDWQGKGVGTELVAASEETSRRLGFSKIVLHARETAVRFYEKMNYTRIGEQFEEVSIPHFKMEKRIK